MYFLAFTSHNLILNLTHNFKHDHFVLHIISATSLINYLCIAVVQVTLFERVAARDVRGAKKKACGRVRFYYVLYARLLRSAQRVLKVWICRLIRCDTLSEAAYGEMTTSAPPDSISLSAAICIKRSAPRYFINGKSAPMQKQKPPNPIKGVI